MGARHRRPVKCVVRSRSSNSNIKLIATHDSDYIYIGQNKVKADEIVKFDFYGHQVDITPFLYCWYEAAFNPTYALYERLGKIDKFFYEITGNRFTSDLWYVVSTDILEQIEKDPEKLLNTYPILRAYAFPPLADNAMRERSPLIACSQYYLIDKPQNLATLMLNFMYLAFNKEFQPGGVDRLLRYDLRSKMVPAGKSPKSDLSFNISDTLCIDWVIQVFRKYLDTRDSITIKDSMDAFDKEKYYKLCFKYNSKFKSCLLGKTSVEDLIADRFKEYKSRLCDFNFDAMQSFLGTNLNVNEILDNLDFSIVKLDVLRYTSIGSERYAHHLAQNSDEIFAAYKSIGSMLNVEKITKQYTDTVQELDKTVKSQERGIRKRDNKIQNLEMEVTGLKKQITDLKKQSNSSDKPDKELSNMVYSLQSKLSKALEEKQAASLELSNKRSECSRLIKENKRIPDLESQVADLQAKIEQLTLDEQEIEQDVPLQNKIDFLNKYSILVAGGYKSMADTLVNKGLKLRWADKMADPAVSSKFDLVIVMTDYISHAMEHKIMSQCSKLGAVSVYVQGSNAERIIGVAYHYMHSNLEKSLTE